MARDPAEALALWRYHLIAVIRSSGYSRYAEPPIMPRRRRAGRSSTSPLGRVR